MLGTVLVLACAATLLASRPDQSTPPPRDFKGPDVLRVSAYDDLKPRTETEIALAKSYDLTGSELRVNGQEQPGVHLMGDDFLVPADGSPKNVEDDPNILRRLTCGHSVVLGKVVTRQAFVNPSKTGIFTISRIAVLRWLSPRQGEQHIDIGLNGGKVYVGADLYQSPGRYFDVGSTLLLFVERIIGNTYATHGSYEVVNNRLSVGTVHGDLESVLAREKDVVNECR